ncbi:hypothetical protein, partial [uncultured Fibrobacter sp.]|uniref:hypothetical protein n=1 Tax=uncultured Fibrobacter sp. TaxID=261512 RepID=UPI0025E73C4C
GTSGLYTAPGSSPGTRRKERRFTASETLFFFLYKTASNNNSHLYTNGRETGAFVSKWASPFARGCATTGFFYMNSAHPVYIPLQVRVLAPAEKKAICDKQVVFFYLTEVWRETGVAFFC